MVTTLPAPRPLETPHMSHGESSPVAHHFESAQQQFDAGKLGMWLFLVTEILFFSGLFVAYAVYRSNHPEVFVEAHRYLNTTLGAFNTIVLLFSSLTMAWAVRCAQLGQQKALTWLLAVTLACASLFLGVKAVEYSHKWGEGLLWAAAFSADQAAEHDHELVHQQTLRALAWLSSPAALCVFLTAICALWAWRRQSHRSLVLWSGLLAASLAFFLGVGTGEFVQAWSTPAEPHAASHLVGQTAANLPAAETGVTTEMTPGGMPATRSLTGVFFSIYYVMTGIHAVHIVVGMGVIVWLFRRSLRGDFGPDHFAPVDFVGLYWHLVDLVWIYLFPLLYLIR